MTEHNNPPAFPTTEANGCNSGQPGLTLLDHFAGLAMQGHIATGEVCGHANRSKFAYEMADAMLKEREKWIK